MRSPRTARYQRFAFLLTVSLLAAVPAQADDAAAIRQAVENYANAFYQVKPELLEVSVHPHVQKVGYFIRQDSTREQWATFWELLHVAETFNVDFKRFDPATAKREIRILDQFDRIATARLDAEWGVDYLHLTKLDGEWKIMNVIWQTYPPEPETAEE